jgi:hypothetical protein
MWKRGTTHPLYATISPQEQEKILSRTV